MENWSRIKNAYLTGEGSLGQLAERFGLSYETVRRRAAREKWKEQRSSTNDPRITLERQMNITSRLLDIVSSALDDPDELYIWVEPVKSANGGYSCERLRALNEARLGRLVKTLADIFEMQYAALQIPRYKERHDAENAARKLELELLKLENSMSQDVICDDGFLDALGGGQAGL